jgi:hypothetical protein
MTPTLQLPKEQVALLDAADVEAYLLGHDWQEDPGASSSKVGTFRYRPSPEVVIRVPRDRAYLDYALRVGDVLQALAVVERRKAWEVMEDLLARRQVAPANGVEGSRPQRARGPRSQQ